MAARLEDVERIFQDISNCGNVKSLEIVQNSQSDMNHIVQLRKHKSHLEALKTKVVGLQTQSKFLDKLAKENWSSTDDTEIIQEHQAYMKDERKRDKQAIEDLETEIDNLSETLCTKYQLMKEKLVLLEQRLSATRNKKTEYETLQEKAEQMTRKLKEKENTKDILEEYEEKQVGAELAIRECKAALCSLEHCRELLQLEVSRLQSSVTGLQQELETQETARKCSDEKEERHRQWLAGAVDLYSNLGGMTVKSVQGDSIILELPNDSPSNSQLDDTPLILTIMFRLEGGTHAVFAGAEVNLESLFIKDLVDEAIRSADVVGFILKVKNRARNQRMLINEVEELQKNYAMDWEPSHGRVRVMLGRSGKIVCILRVDPLYSIGRGHVSLLGVEGNSDKNVTERLQGVNSSRSLTEWIKELQETFSNQ